MLNFLARDYFFVHLSDMKTLSTTIEYKGMPVKVEGGQIYLRAFGTTIHNRSMHWSWARVSKDNLKAELRSLLEKQGLI